MLFCSDTLNARNHLPGTTILVPSVQFFFLIIFIIVTFIVTAKFQWKSSLWQSGKSSMFPSKPAFLYELSLPKAWHRVLTPNFKTQINQQIITKMYLEAMKYSGQELSEAVLNNYSSYFPHQDLAMVT